MKTFKAYLQEKNYSGQLYHATGPLGLYDIITSGRLQFSERESESGSSVSKSAEFRERYFLSMSRSKRNSYNFDTFGRMGHLEKGARPHGAPFTMCVLTFDSRKISSKYRVKPHKDSGEIGVNNPGTEAEERLLSNTQYHDVFNMGLISIDFYPSSKTVEGDLSSQQIEEIQSKCSINNVKFIYHGNLQNRLSADRRRRRKS